MGQLQNSVIADWKAWRTLRWTGLGFFMALLDATILFVAFPSIRRSFPAVSAADLSWVLNAYTVIHAAMLVPAGRIADQWGRRRLFLTGISVFAAGSLACGLSPSPLFLIGGRIVQALGGAMLMPSSLALILQAFPRPKWPVAVSLWAAVGALAAALGPSLGGIIVQFVGWRWAFFINLPVAALVLARAPGILDESEDSDVKDLPDLIGVALLAVGLGVLALGIVELPEWNSYAVAVCLTGSAVLLGWFVLRSRDEPVPALDLSLFRIATFSYANTAMLVFGAAFSAMFLGSVLFLTSVWGYETARAGLAMTPGPLIVIVVAPLSGRLATRIGHRALLISGGVVFGLGFLLRGMITSVSPHYATEWLPVVVMTGIGVGLVMPSLGAVAVHSLPKDQFAVGSGVNLAVRQIGSVLGVAITIALVGNAHGPGSSVAFSKMFFLLALGGFLTAAISAPIDTRPVSQRIEIPQTKEETSAALRT